MNTFQHQLTEDIVSDLSKRPQTLCVALVGDLARSEGDDFSPVTLCVLTERVGAQDLIHTREQWAAQFGSVLSFLYPAGDEGGCEEFEMIYDEECDSTIVRVVIYEVEQSAAYAEYVRGVGYSILFQRDAVELDAPVSSEAPLEEQKAQVQHAVWSIWHAIPAVTRSIRRERIPEAVDGYLMLVNALADVLRVQHAPQSHNTGLSEASIDFDAATVRSLESLTEDIRFAILPELLEAYCDLFEKVSMDVAKSLHISVPSKTMARSLRKSFLP